MGGWNELKFYIFIQITFMIRQRYQTGWKHIWLMHRSFEATLTTFHPPKLQSCINKSFTELTYLNQFCGWNLIFPRQIQFAFKHDGFWMKCSVRQYRFATDLEFKSLWFVSLNSGHRLVFSLTLLNEYILVWGLLSSQQSLIYFGCAFNFKRIALCVMLIIFFGRKVEAIK